MLVLLWNLFEQSVNIYDAVIIMYFICESFGHDLHSRRNRTTYFVGVIIMASIITILNNITIYEGLLGLVYSVYFFIFSVICLKGTLIKKLFISILTNVILISVNAVIGNLISYVFKNNLEKIYSEHCISRFLYMIIVQALLAYIFSIVLRFTKKDKTPLRPKEWVLILSVLGISFLIFTAIHFTILNAKLSNDYINVLMACEFGVILINIVCYIMTVNMSIMRSKEEELTYIAQQNEYSRKYAETVNEQYSAICRIRHDMKQYCTVLDSLISKGETANAQEFISQTFDEISKTEFLINVGNVFVNSILNAKLNIAKSKDIEVICSVDKKIGGVNDIDLCSLLGNLLDNAIEAAEQCQTDLRFIELNITCSTDTLNITISNSINMPVLCYNPKLLTTKKDSEHGFGTKTIRAIAEKYNGSIDYFEKNLTFTAKVTLVKNEKLI